jgi:hypothetical protein
MFVTLALCGWWPLAAPAQDSRYVVTNTNDRGPGSLQSAIENANSDPGKQTISFNIPGAGPHTIQPLTTTGDRDPVIIDGYTQPVRREHAAGNNAVLLIELDGSAAK